MELNINTLTQEQKNKIDMWFNIFLNNDWKLVEEIPTEKNDLYKKYLSDQAYTKFNDTLNIINWSYTENEQKTFEIKRTEAQKVIDGWSSVFLENLCIDWESVEDLALKIIENSTNYQFLYATAEKQLREDLKNI